MSFPRYPKYKDSGVEWLGDVPDHWEVKPLYSSVAERDEPNRGMVEDNLLSLSYGRIVQKDITSNDGLLPESFETYQIVRPGDIVFRLTDLQNDKRSLRSAIVEETGIITSAYLAVAPRGPDSKYLSYLFRAYDVTKVFYSMGGGLRQSMKFADLKRMPTLLPPPEEQTQIAAFLDGETAKLDELVVEQRRLMELLKEKRQAVISHAVTRGLHPHAPMKYSGVEWLGDVPAHWDLMPLRRCLIEHRQGYYSEAPYVESGVKLLRITDLRDFGKVDFTQCPQVESLTGLEPFLLKSSDFVFARTGGAGTFGLVETVTAPAAYASYLIRFRFSDETHANFLRYFFLSSWFEISVRQNIHGGVNKNIHAEDIKNQFIALPPISEQIEISELLDFETAKLDTLTAEAELAIDLLQERRTALISAVVTGQIDIRNFIADRKVT